MAERREAAAEASRFTIVIPTWREAGNIVACLQALQRWRGAAEIVVADGGSDDATAALARPLADQVIQAPRGRARQMNAGAAAARGKILIFLHADTRLPPEALDRIEAAISAGFHWGRFDVRLDCPHPLLKLVAVMMNWRSRLSGIATGDQAIFVTRGTFEAVGGFADLPLMEDIDLSRRLKRLGAPACLKAKVTTSARRWRRFGIGRTILLMWWLRLRFFLGGDPGRLACCYQRGRFG